MVKNWIDGFTLQARSGGRAIGQSGDRAWMVIRQSGDRAIGRSTGPNFLPARRFRDYLTQSSLLLLELSPLWSRSEIEFGHSMGLNG